VTDPAQLAPLSARLSTIDKLIGQDYHHIWDCCCDHGYLGRHLLMRNAAPDIHLVDIVPDIMSKLTEVMAKQPVGKSQYHLYCQDVASLPLDNYPVTDKHIIIIAGVGGDLTLQFVKQLVSDNPNKTLEFILCPLRQQFHLRQQLATCGLKLIDEQLVKDDKLFYEVIHLTTGKGEPIVGIGSKLWQQPNQWHLPHLEIMLAHFKRMANNPLNDVSAAITDYQHLLTKLTNQMALPK